MIYIGNGIYSDAGPKDYIMHYGVPGMKWGQHLFGRTWNAGTRYGKSVRKNIQNMTRRQVGVVKEGYKATKKIAKNPKKVFVEGNRRFGKYYAKKSRADQAKTKLGKALAGTIYGASGGTLRYSPEKQARNEKMLGKIGSGITKNKKKILAYNSPASAVLGTYARGSKNMAKKYKSTVDEGFDIIKRKYKR